MDTYGRRRRENENISGQRIVATTGTSGTLKAAKNANYTIYIQRLHVHITTGSASKTWSVEDNGSPIRSLTDTLSAAVAPASHEIDFGADGVALTEGKDLVLTIGATGAAGIVVWEGYQKLTAVIGIYSRAEG